MTTPTRPKTRAPHRRRRRVLWVLGGAVVLVALLLVAATAFSGRTAPAPLALPPTVAAPSGAVDGTWQPAPGSAAGFRIRQTMLGTSSDVVGRTEGVAGRAVIAGGQVTSAEFRVDLRTLTSDGGKPAPQFATSLDVARFPEATIALARPVGLGDAFASGATATVTADVRITLHGTTRTVAVPLSARRDGTGVDVAGVIPVAFTDYGIAAPEGYGFLGSLADRGDAEFLLILAGERR